MNGMYEELLEKLRKNNRMSGWTHIDRLMDDAIKAIEALQQENEQLQEFANAKADGRLVVLPCKVGSKVYEPETDESARVDSVEIYFHTHMGAYTLDDFGETVFLTREAAEKALGGGEG